MKKKIIVLIILLILFGCNNPKDVNKEIKEEPCLEQINEKSVQSIASDTTYSPHIKIKKLLIPTENVGKIKEDKGIIRYCVPDSMEVGKTYTVNLRIAKQKDSISIKIGMPVGVTDEVRVGSTMEAKLEDPGVDKFEIIPLDSKIQTIEDDEDFTMWRWTVRPLKKGNNELILVVTIKDKDLTKDIPVYDKKILVHANYFYTIKGFTEENWKYILTTIVIPLLGFFTHKTVKKNKKKKNSEE